jgi:hypothetical protein
MIDEILAGIFGEAVFGRFRGSRRSQLLARLFFGLLGAGLGAAGALHFASSTNLTRNTAMHASMIAVFLFMTCFSLFNIALGRQWRWPGKLFILSLASLFVSRILLG